MSLDVWLKIDHEVEHEPKIYIREGGQNREISREEWNERFPNRAPVVVEAYESAEVFSYNITHNLNRMASEAGLYEAMWRPEEIDATRAGQLIARLEAGLAALEADPERFKQFNPSNGWGDYEGLVRFARKYLEACKAWPDAKIGTSR